MTVSDGDILKCVVTIDLPLDVKAQNVFYLRQESAIDYSNSVVLTAIQGWVENLYDNFDSSVHSTVALSDVLVSKWLWSALDLWHTGEFVGQEVLADIFASGGDMLPHATAAIVTGGTADPLCVSRKSFPGFAEGTQAGSEVAAVSLVDLAAAAVAWLTDQTLTGADFLVPGVPAKGGVWQELLVATVGSIMGSQRRRKPGVGI